MRASGGRVLALAAVCAAAVFAGEDAGCKICASDGARSYTCASRFEDVRGGISGHPHHAVFAAEARNLAAGLAGWVRDVLEEDETTLPLTFAYYANPSDSPLPCAATAIPPFVPHGGGAPMCDMIQWSAGVGPDKSLGRFLLSIMDLACAARGRGCTTSVALMDWQHVKHNLVAPLGILPYKKMQHWANGTCPDGVYHPDGVCRTPAQTMAHNAEVRRLAAVAAAAEAEAQRTSDDGIVFVDRLPDADTHALHTVPPAAGEYYGMSGGGGSGAGFDIHCEDPHDANASHVSIMGGGGGGGAGASSPRSCTSLNAGGGGGGGVYVTGVADIGLGGGGGHQKGDAAVVGDNFGNDPEAFAGALKTAAGKMRACKAAGKVVTLRGGGGGGGGFEAYKRFNLSDCKAPQKEADTAFGYGYGFQFAVGAGAKLEANAANGEDVYVQCPARRADGGAVECDNCVSQNDPGAARMTRAQQQAISKTFACADAFATKVCAAATAADGTAYTAFDNYALCNCPVSKAYLDAHLPANPAWDHVRSRPCVFKVPGPDGKATDNTESDAGLPELTVADIKAHPRWYAAAPEGCLPLFAAPGAPADATTKRADLADEAPAPEP